VTLDSSIPQFFKPDLSGFTNYAPSLMANLQLHFFNQKRGIDISEEYCLTLPLGPNTRDLNWKDALNDEGNGCGFDRLPSKAPSDINYGPVPEFVSSDKKLSKAARELKDWAYHSFKLELYRTTRVPKMESRPNELLGDFKVRLTDAMNDLKEEEIHAMKERYAKKEKVLTDRLERAMASLDKEKSDSTGSLIKAGVTILGVLFGKSRASIGTAGTRVFKERGDISRAEERVQKIQGDIEELEYELEEKIDELAEKYSADDIKIEDFAIKPRKTDIVVDNIALIWSTE